MPLTWESCRRNPEVDWLCYSDQTPSNLPDNFRCVKTTLRDYLTRIGDTLGYPLGWKRPYKLCDVRPVLGHVHADELKQYTHWGWGDLDLVYGRLREHWDDNQLNHLCWTTHEDRIAGHLSIFQNTDEGRKWYKRIPKIQQRIQSFRDESIDETRSARVLTQRYAKEQHRHGIQRR